MAHSSIKYIDIPNCKCGRIAHVAKKYNKSMLICIAKDIAISKLPHENIGSVCQFDMDSRRIIQPRYCAFAVSALDSSYGIKMITGIARGLAFLHANNIIHGDLKVDNFVIDSKPHSSVDADTQDKVAKIIDFSMSFSDTCENKYSVAYAERYRPPEIIPRKRNSMGVSGEIMKPAKYDFSADIWAFGAVLYQLLTKREFDIGPLQRNSESNKDYQVRKSRYFYANSIEVENWLRSDLVQSMRAVQGMICMHLIDIICGALRIHSFQRISAADIVSRLVAITCDFYAEKTILSLHQEDANMTQSHLTDVTQSHLTNITQLHLTNITPQVYDLARILLAVATTKIAERPFLLKDIDMLHSHEGVDTIHPQCADMPIYEDEISPLDIICEQETKIYISFEDFRRAIIKDIDLIYAESFAYELFKIAVACGGNQENNDLQKICLAVASVIFTDTVFFMTDCTTGIDKKKCQAIMNLMI